MKNKYLLFTLFFTTVFLASGCVFYQRYPLAQSRLTKINKTNLTFYLLDASHPRSRAWHMSEADFQDQAVHCFLIKLDEFDAQEVSTIHNNRDARESRDEVLLFAKPRFVFSLADTVTMTIPYEQLEKIEVIEANHGKSVGVSMFIILIPLVILGILSDY